MILFLLCVYIILCTYVGTSQLKQQVTTLAINQQLHVQPPLKCKT